MDHLPYPNGGNRPAIQVPVLSDISTGIAIYDGGDFTSFPSRRGYQTLLGANGKDQILDIEALSEHSYWDTLAFIQAWLFFGTLHEASRIMDLQCDEEAFIRRTEAGAFLDTSDLNALLKPQTCNDPNPCIRMCENVMAQVENLEVSWLCPQRKATPLPEILLSIRVLAITLCSSDSEEEDSMWRVRDSFGALSPSVLPIYHHLISAERWCPHQALRSSAEFSPITLYYLAGVKRKRNMDHSRCLQTKRCVSSNIGQDTVSRHVPPCNGHTCPSIAAVNPDSLTEILDRGNIPLIIASRSRGCVELRYVTAKPDLPYTAVSHVWSDGLGDPTRNDLPRCQVMRLLSRIHEADRCHTLGRGRFSGTMSAATRVLEEQYPDFLERPIAFWLDAYCIPAHSAVQQTVNLKRAAIMRMVPTYSLARNVLVIDSELSQVPDQNSALDLMAALSICTWKTRYWTHQELTLAGTDSVTVQFDQPMRLSDLLQTTDHAERGVDDVHPRAIPNGTLRARLIARMSSELASKLRESKVGWTSVTKYRPAVTGYGRFKVSSQMTDHAFFIKMWSSFLGKTSSIPEDMHSILANLLNLNAAAVVELPAGQRVLAVFASFQRLPMNLLLSCPPLTLPDMSRHESSCDVAPEDHWMSRLPDDRDIPLDPLDDDFFWQATPKGLVCSPRVSRHTYSIHSPPKEVWGPDGWFIRIRSSRGPADPYFSWREIEEKEELCIHVSLLSESDANSTTFPNGSMLLFLPSIKLLRRDDRRRSEHRSLPAMSWRRGACFQRADSHERRIRAHWICAVKYRALAATELNWKSSNAVGTSICRHKDTKRIEIEIICSRHPSTWPRIKAKRQPGAIRANWNRLNKDMNGDTGLFWHIHLLLIAAVVVLTIGTVGRTLYSASWAPLFLIWGSLMCLQIIFATCVYVGALADWYIGLATYYENDDEDAFWWQRLRRTLPWSPSVFQQGKYGKWHPATLIALVCIWVLHFLIFILAGCEAVCTSCTLSKKGKGSFSGTSANTETGERYPLLGA